MFALALLFLEGLNPKTLRWKTWRRPHSSTPPPRTWRARSRRQRVNRVKSTWATTWPTTSFSTSHSMFLWRQVFVNLVRRVEVLGCAYHKVEDHVLKDYGSNRSKYKKWYLFDKKICDWAVKTSQPLSSCWLHHPKLFDDPLRACLFGLSLIRGIIFSILNLFYY